MIFQPKIPAGIWEIYRTRSECCKGNKDCIPQNELEATGAPTPYPTMGDEPDTPETEMIPIELSVVGLPTDVNAVAFQEKLRNILRTILLELATKYDSLKILNLLYRSVNGSDRMIYDATIRYQEDRDFGRIIQNAIESDQESIAEEVLEWIRYQSIVDNEGSNFQLCFESKCLNGPQPNILQIDLQDVLQDILQDVLLLFRRWAFRNFLVQKSYQFNFHPLAYLLVWMLWHFARRCAIY